MLLWLALACGEEKEQTEVGFGDALEDGWNKIVPGGDTMCSRGSEFAFAVRKGSSPNIVIDFVGGGACWDELTCGFADATFTDNVDWVDDIAGTTDAGEGIYNIDNPDNPFSDYHHVLIPYCTGDIHWGNQTKTYGSGNSEVTIHHKGGVNAQAVMDWVAENYRTPEKIFVTGCSAGAYGSIMWAPHVAEMYPDADLRQFGDSGAGVVTEEWFADSFPHGMVNMLFPLIFRHLILVWWMYPKRVPPIYTVKLPLSIPITRSLNSTVISTAFKCSISNYGGGDAEAWNLRMTESVQAVADANSNFSYFTAGGDRHCIIMSDDVFTTTPMV